jgi:hypothetical protein
MYTKRHYIDVARIVRELEQEQGPKTASAVRDGLQDIVNKESGFDYPLLKVLEEKWWKPKGWTDKHHKLLVELDELLEYLTDTPYLELLDVEENEL